MGTNPFIVHTTKYELVGLMVEVYERGQIVIPKYIRDMLHITPGSKLNVRVEGNKIIFETSDFEKEIELIRSKYANLSDEQVDKLITKSRNKRHKEWLDVPGL